MIFKVMVVLPSSRHNRTSDEIEEIFREINVSIENTGLEVVEHQ